MGIIITGVRSGRDIRVRFAAGAVTVGSDGLPTGSSPLGARKCSIGALRATVFHVRSQLCYLCGGEAYAFNYQSMKWSAPTMVKDFAEGEIVSGVVQNGEAAYHLLNDGEFDLYEFDEPADDTAETGSE